jgi:hypothetical protein
MIMSGLRTSWAITAENRPSAESRSRSAASRFRRATESESTTRMSSIVSKLRLRR